MLSQQLSRLIWLETSGSELTDKCLGIKTSIWSLRLASRCCISCVFMFVALWSSMAYFRKIDVAQICLKLIAVIVSINLTWNKWIRINRQVSWHQNLYLILETSILMLLQLWVQVLSHCGVVWLISKLITCEKNVF